jgi:hypothetical protein
MLSTDRPTHLIHTFVAYTPLDLPPPHTTRFPDTFVNPAMPIL